MSKSRYGAIRSRAVALLLDSFNHAHADASYAEAWRQVVPLLVEATRGQDGKTREAALTLLGLLGPEAAGALHDLRTLARESHDAAIRKSAEAAISSIDSMERLHSKDPAARIAASETLSRMNWRATPGIPDLIAALKDPQTKVKVAAAHALGSLGEYSKLAVTPLLALCRPSRKAERGRRFWRRWRPSPRATRRCSMPIATPYVIPIPKSARRPSASGEFRPTISGSKLWVRHR